MNAKEPKIFVNFFRRRDDFDVISCIENNLSQDRLTGAAGASRACRWAILGDIMNLKDLWQLLALSSRPSL